MLKFQFKKFQTKSPKNSFVRTIENIIEEKLDKFCLQIIEAEVFWEKKYSSFGDRMTPKWPWTLQGQRNHRYVLLLPAIAIPKFHSISLYDRSFSR